MPTPVPPCSSAPPSALWLDRPIVLVGLMGAGKTRIGGLIARELDIPFVDSDTEVERAAGMAVRSIFDTYGEPAFRDCEAKVMQRLVTSGPQVIATGGGAFINAETRSLIKQRAVSLWLKAELAVLLERTAQSGRRPLLQVDDPGAVLSRLMEVRYPIYAEADITLDSGEQTPQDMARLAIATIRDFLEQGQPADDI